MDRWPGALKATTYLLKNILKILLFNAYWNQKIEKTSCICSGLLKVNVDFIFQV